MISIHEWPTQTQPTTNSLQLPRHNIKLCSKICAAIEYQVQHSNQSPLESPKKARSFVEEQTNEHILSSVSSVSFIEKVIPTHTQRNDIEGLLSHRNTIPLSFLKSLRGRSGLSKQDKLVPRIFWGLSSCRLELESPQNIRGTRLEGWNWKVPSKHR